MKKLCLMCLFLLLLSSNVYALDAVIVTHKVMVTNKEGTICYNDGVKSDVTIPYKTMLMVSTDIKGNYINVSNDDYNCDVKYSDVSANTQSFDVNHKDVEKINSLRAIVLSETGLNMRVGPSVTYAKVMTVPKNSVLILTHKAGTYWYYTEYNGKLGWITAMNNYVGYNYNKVLINYEKTNIYDASGKKILGTIPANTEIVDYVKIESIDEDNFKYYVIYNGTKGYIKEMLYKTNGTGKIRLNKAVDIVDENNNPIKKMSSGSEIEYTMTDGNNRYFFPEKNSLVSLNTDDFEYINEVKLKVKEAGYIGEGLFGEEIMEKEEIVPEEEPKKEETRETSITTTEIIIIGLLAGILVTLIMLIIIKVKSNKKNEYNKEV